MKKNIFSLFLMLTLFSSSLLALPLAELQVKFESGTDPKIIDEVRRTIGDEVSKSKWKYDNNTRAKLGNAKDCFTEECLKNAGKRTGAPAGLRIRFSGEAQIYDWSIDIYNLRTGSILKRKKGACELCGRTEVTRSFAKSLQSALSGAKLRNQTQTVTPIVRKKAKKKKTTVKKEQTVPEKKGKHIRQTDSKRKKTSKSENTLPDIDNYKPVTITKVVFDVQPEDAIILMNGKRIGTGSTTMELSPGSYDFQFQREGYAGFKETLVVGETNADRVQFRVHLSKTDPDAVRIPASEGAVDRLEKRQMWGWIGVGSGAVLLTTGIILNRMDGQATCNSGRFQQCPEVYDTSTASIISATTGSILLSTGLGLLLWETLAGDSTGNTAIAPQFDSNRQGISVIHRF